MWCVGAAWWVIQCDGAVQQYHVVMWGNVNYITPGTTSSNLSPT